MVAQIEGVDCCCLIPCVRCIQPHTPAYGAVTFMVGFPTSLNYVENASRHTQRLFLGASKAHQINNPY